MFFFYFFIALFPILFPLAVSMTWALNRFFGNILHILSMQRCLKFLEESNAAIMTTRRVKMKCHTARK